MPRRLIVHYARGRPRPLSSSGLALVHDCRGQQFPRLATRLSASLRAAAVRRLLLRARIERDVDDARGKSDGGDDEILFAAVLLPPAGRPQFLRYFRDQASA